MSSPGTYGKEPLAAARAAATSSLYRRTTSRFCKSGSSMKARYLCTRRCKARVRIPFRCMSKSCSKRFSASSAK
eukprot:15469224-Alexandrium_andersonii.AAC.2